MDILQYVRDLEQGKTTISPEDLAPDFKPPKMAGNIIYDEENDPEIEQQEKVEESLKRGKLREAVQKAKPMKKWLETAKDASWEAFQKSGLADELELDENLYSHWCNVMTTEKGVTPLADNWPRKVGKKSSYGSGGAATNEKKRTPGPYDSDKAEDYVSGNTDVASLAKDYGGASLKGTAEETFTDIFNIVYNIIVGRSDKRHACVAGDPGIGKTYLVTETCNKYMSKSPTKAKLVYESGDIGSAMSSLIPFFYVHSKNKIIVLDDNDKMIMNNLDQKIMNIVKALLDPTASDKKPITVANHMRPIFAKMVSNFDVPEEELEESKSDVFELDMEALKENICRLYVNDQLVIDEYISLHEAEELRAKFRPLREVNEPNIYAKFLREHSRRFQEADPKGRLGTNRELLDDLVGGDDDDDEDLPGMTKEDRRIAKEMKKQGTSEQADDDGSFPSRFLFDSSVIFISNLTTEQINTAVIDRVELVEVKLTLDQFLERLGSIYSGLCKGSKYSSIPQKHRDWAKKCVYTTLDIFIEAWKSNTVLFGSPVEINRKLTFRFFDECVVAWLRYAYDKAERVYGKSLDDEAFRNKLSRELIPEVIRRKMIPALKMTVK